MMKFKIGDVCVTQNSRAAALNDGLLVVVVGVDPTFVGPDSEHAPYAIRRLDGQPFAFTRGLDGDLQFYRCSVVQAREKNLRKVVPSREQAAADVRRELLALLDEQVAAAEPVGDGVTT